MPSEIITFEGVQLSVAWHPGRGVSIDRAPRQAGVYAQIYWPEAAVRIGQSSNIRNRFKEATTWALAMCARTARQSQLRRSSPICERVKATGNRGFEFFIVSTDPRLRDRDFRMACEAHLFGWLRAVGDGRGWCDWNDEKVRLNLRPVRDAAWAAYRT